MRIRYWRILRPLLGGMVAALVLAMAALGVYTRTSWGRGHILAITLRTLGGKLNGTLKVQRLDGNLFTGARLYRVSLAESNGQPLLTADSAYIDYDLPTFFGGDVVIHRLVLFNADLRLRRLPGDSLWNYQQVLLDTTATPGTGPGKATIIDQLRLVGGHVVVRMPWSPDSTASASEQRQAVAAILSDTSRQYVERVPGGFLETWRFQLARGQLSQLTIAPDERGGTYLGIDTLRATAQIYRGSPLVLEQAAGQIALRDGILRYRAPLIVLPGSRLSSDGRIDMREPAPKYDLGFNGQRVSLADVQWIYPPLPDTGTARFQLWLETHPDGLYYKVRDLRLTTTGTRLTGSVGVVYGDSLVFTDMDLHADPFDVKVATRIFGVQLPIDGLHIGSADAATPSAAREAGGGRPPPSRTPGRRS
ncbi:MAG TPA: hypothetical protein VFL93_03690 [Longimicrobiaceae bacterium]|nr:hypothetical protein [Longimicrobiaceae bacterium]